MGKKRPTVIYLTVWYLALWVKFPPGMKLFIFYQLLVESTECGQDDRHAQRKEASARQRGAATCAAPLSPEEPTRVLPFPGPLVSGDTAARGQSPNMKPLKHGAVLSPRGVALDEITPVAFPTERDVTSPPFIPAHSITTLCFACI